MLIWNERFYQSSQYGSVSGYLNGITSASTIYLFASSVGALQITLFSVLVCVINSSSYLFVPSAVKGYLYI